MVETHLSEVIDYLQQDIPDLNGWEPTEDQIFYIYENEAVRAKYEEMLGLREGSRLSLFVINKNHYRTRMEDVCKHINYFETFYDDNHELFTSSLSVKFIIDQNPNLKMTAFRDLILSRIITPTLVTKLKAMANHLYTININTDEEGKYKNTPKITNDHARQIVAVSFCIRCILPLCVHYSDTNNNFIQKRDYIGCFDKIFIKIIKIFEKDDIHIINALCKFVKYRVDRSYNADLIMWQKKKQLYGTVKSVYLEDVIHEVIIVKSLHKLDYGRSVVSFVDGVIFSYHKNFKQENFAFKPVEIEPAENSSDEGEHLSHAEAIEMSVYRVDESDALINEVNAVKVMKSIEEGFHITLSEEEVKFYYDNIKISSITQLFLHSFYSKFFHDTNAIYNLNKISTVKLLIYMKKFLQLRGMVIIPQLCTSVVRGKFKDNVIKNSKFIEKFQSSSVYNNIITTKFKYMKELNPKEDPIIKKLSAFINSTFVFVDCNDDINGMEYDDINMDLIIDEFLLFLSII